MNSTDTLAALRNERGAAQGRMDTLVAGKRAALREQTTFAAYEAELQAVDAEIRRLDELIAEGEADHASEQLRRADEELHADKIAARKRSEKNAKKIHDVGAKVASLIKGLFADLAEAAAEDAELNRQLPSNDQIVSAEVIARTRRALPRVELRTEPIMIWTFAESGAPVGNPSLVIVDADKPNEGYVQSAAVFGGSDKPCVRRKYRRNFFHPPTETEFPTATLASALRLPDFAGPGWSWNGSDLSVDTPHEILARLTIEPRRPVHEEMLPDEDDDAEPDDATAGASPAANDDVEFDHASED